VVGFAAGQAIDILARLIAQSLSEQFAQQFIVDNKPGSGGNIATEGVARAPARLQRRVRGLLEGLAQARVPQIGHRAASSGTR